MTDTRQYPISEPEGWVYEDSLSVLGMSQDHYRTKAGFKCIVSKDFPPGLIGWHISIGPRGRSKIGREALDEEVLELLDSLEVSFILVWESPRTGARNFHEDIWTKEGEEVPQFFHQ